MHRWTAGAVVVALVGSACSSSAPSAARPARRSHRATPTTLAPGHRGGPSGGDPYFPESGNSGYDVAHYDLQIAYTPSSPRIRATTTVASVATQDLARFNLDFAGLTIDAITVDGKPATYSRSASELTVRPRTEVKAGAQFSTRVTYHGVPKTVRDPSESAPAEAAQLGWTRNPDDGTVYVVSEPIGARTWFPSNDHPSDKATFDITVDVPTAVSVASNGALTEGAVANGRRQWHWSMTRPMTTYLATVVIAPMREEDPPGPTGVTLRNFFPAERYAEGVNDFAKTRSMIEYFSDVFGAYPFDQYGAVVVREELGYALENQTMSVFGSDMLGTDMEAETTVAHELAHQWFGDSVSILRWSDIWLNEGWATYAQYLWQAHADPSFDLNRFMVDLRASKGPELTPPHDPGADGLFTEAIYERGALTLHALRLTVGDAVFFSIAKAWTDKYRYGTATTADFIALAGAVSGQDLTGFFRHWLDDDAVPRLP